MISAAEIREAGALLGWTLPTLAGRAQPCFDAVSLVLDDVGIHGLGGLQLGTIRDALEAAGVIFIDQNGGGPGVRLRDPLP